MQILKYKRVTFLQIIIFVICVLLLILTYYYSIKVVTGAPISSVEVGVSTPSPRGASGGYAIPASCPSFVHASGQCSLCADAVDVGLRIFDGGVVRRVGVEPGGSAVSRLRVYKNGIRKSVV